MERNGTPLNGKSHNRNYRSGSESKLNRRTFALPIEEQERILQDYRDRGLATGRASHTGVINDNSRNKSKTKIMEPDDTTLPESHCKFMSYAIPWEHRKTIEHVLMDVPGGKEVAVGRIEVDIDQNTGQRTFRAFGQDGKELFPRRTSLYWLKKDFIRHEDELYRTAVINLNRPTLGGSLKQLTDDLKSGKLTEPILSPYQIEAKRTKQLKRINKTQQRSKGKSRGR